MIVVLGIGAVVFIVLLTFALCRMAAAGDRQLARARDDLAGPRERARVGITPPSRRGRPWER